MSCKSALFCINLSEPTLNEGASVPLGSTIRRFGPNIRLDGTGILVKDSGYYDIEASFTVTPSATGIVTIQLYQDGVAVPGGLASATVAATDTTVNLNILAIIRVQGCGCVEETSMLDFKIIENGATINNAAVKVEKI